MLLTQGGVWRRSQTGLQADSHLNQLQGFTNLHDLHLHHQQCLFNIIIIHPHLHLAGCDDGTPNVQ